MRRPLAILGSSLVFAILLAPSAFADPACLTSSMSTYGVPKTYSNSAPLDTMLQVDGGNPYLRVHHDAARDTMGVSMGNVYGGYGGWLRAGMRYRVIGPAPGSPVTVTVRVPVSGGAYPALKDVPTSASAEVSLLVNGATVASESAVASCDGVSHCFASGSLPSTMTAVFASASGQEFTTELILYGLGDGNTMHAGNVVIEAGMHILLSPGAFIVSCLGDTSGVHVLDAGGGTLSDLRIRGTGANPSRGPLAVEFTVPRGGPATLQLLDVAGRVIESAVWDAVSAGEHHVTLGAARSMAPGTYFVRLRQGARTDARAVTILN